MLDPLLEFVWKLNRLYKNHRLCLRSKLSWNKFNTVKIILESYFEHPDIFSNFNNMDFKQSSHWKEYSTRIRHLISYFVVQQRYNLKPLQVKLQYCQSAPSTVFVYMSRCCFRRQLSQEILLSYQDHLLLCRELSILLNNVLNTCHKW